VAVDFDAGHRGVAQDSDERTDQENTASVLKHHQRVVSPPATAIKDNAFNSQEPFNKMNP